MIITDLYSVVQQKRHPFITVITSVRAENNLKREIGHYDILLFMYIRKMQLPK